MKIKESFKINKRRTQKTKGVRGKNKLKELFKYIKTGIKEKGLIKFGKEFLFENKTTQQTIMKNTFWLFLAEISNKILLFLTTVLIANILGALKYGQFNFAISFATLFSVLIDFGLSTYSIREIAKNKFFLNNNLITITQIKLILSATAVILGSGIYFIIGYPIELFAFVLLAFTWTIIQNFSEYVLYISQGLEKMHFVAIGKILYATLLIGSIAAITTINSTINFIFLSYIAASLITLVIIAYLVLKKTNFSNTLLEFKQTYELIKESWPFALSILVNALYTYIDISILALFVSFDLIGIYSVSVKILLLLYALGGILASASFPAISRITKTSKSQVKKLINKTIIINIGISIFAIIISLLMDKIIFQIIGSEFSQSYVPFRILLISLPFLYTRLIFGNYLKASNNQLKYFGIILLGAIINISLNFLLIPNFSYLGAAIATTLSEIAVFSISTITYFKLINQRNT